MNSVTHISEVCLLFNYMLIILICKAHKTVFFQRIPLLHILWAFNEEQRGKKRNFSEIDTVSLHRVTA